VTGYLTVQVPSNMILARSKPRWYLSAIQVSCLPSGVYVLTVQAWLGLPLHCLHRGQQ
jgi:hypothetical protein